MGGDVVAEVGPNSVLVVDLVYNLPCLLNGLDDELHFLL